MSSSTSSSRRFVLAALLSGAAALSVALGAIEWRLRASQAEAAAEPSPAPKAGAGLTPWIAVGDSHVASGLVSGGPLENLGQPSDNLASIIAKTEARLAEGGLRGVILQADPQIFSAYRLTDDQTDRVNATQDQWEPPLLLLRPENRRFLQAQLHEMLRQAISPSSETGGGEQTPYNERPRSERLQEAQIRAQLHAPTRGFEDGEAAARYRTLVEKLRAEGVSVCLVRYPVSSLYAESGDALPTVAASIAFMRGIAAANDAPFLDLGRSLNDDAFGDPDHVTYDAAKRLTPEILERCGANGGRAAR